MDMNLMQLRQHLRSAGDAIDVKNTRITTSELMASCGASTPYALCTYPVLSSCLSHRLNPLVPIGGMALGAFLTLHASRRLLASFRKLVVAHDADETVVAGADFMAKVDRSIAARFHGFMLGLQHSNGLRRQRFFVTFMARYHGLSILGTDIVSGMGMIMPSTNYDVMMKEVVADAKRQAR